MGYDTIHGAKQAAACPVCGASGTDNWEKIDTLPNVGGVYKCGDCGEVAYLYDAGPNRSENNIVWRPMRPVIWMDGQFEKIVGDPPRQVSLLESRVRDAIDLEQFDGIYTDPDVYLNEVIVEDESVLADGGMGNVDEGQVARRTFDVDRDVLPDDVLVDLSSDADGARVSWRRVNDILHERVSTEEMQMQEERGLIAGKSSEEVKKMAIYALMAIVGVVAILVLGPPMVQNIFGNGGGGGGGGMIPILLGGFM